MIVNDTITISPFMSPLQLWHPFSSTPNALFVATLTTLLSYQLAAISFDLLQGLKPANRATAARIHLHLLVISQSAIDVLCSTLGKRVADKTIPCALKPSEDLPNDRHRLSPALVVLLITLLAVAPLTSLLSIFLTVEKVQTYSVSSTGMGGIAFGFGKRPLRDAVFYAGCSTFPTSFPPSYEPLVTFLVCLEGMTWENKETAESNTARAEVFVSKRDPVLVRFVLPVQGSPNISLECSYRAAAVLKARIGTFRLAHSMSANDAKRLVRTLMTDLNATRVETGPVMVTEQNDVLHVSQKIVAKDDAARDRLATAILAVLKVPTYFTLVNAERMVGVKEDGSNDKEMQFKDLGTIPILQRRASILDEGVLCVVVAVTVLVRILVRKVTNNDLELGTERILKSFVGIPHDRSLLWAEGDLRYNCQYDVRDDDSVWRKENSRSEESAWSSSDNRSEADRT